MPSRTNVEKSPVRSCMTFVLDENLGLSTEEKAWKEILSGAGISAERSTDLVHIDEMLASHRADIAYIPTADFHRLLAKEDPYYRGLAIATSKFSGEPNQRSLLVVRKDDAANGLGDLFGSQYGYVNKSCTSSYFAPAILLGKQGKRLDEFLKMVPVPAWQGQIDAVTSNKVRATMVLEDIWSGSPDNAQNTKIIGQLDGCKPPVVIVRRDLDEATCKTLLDALMAWMPKGQAVYGAFRPYYYADVQSFFHDLNGLPPGF